MAGILPEGTAGGLVVRDGAGNPTNPPGVQNAYTPAPAFVSDCELTALPSDCTARVEPKQINAIVSELLAFAECLDPDGPWECTSVTNLCTAFNAWIATYEGSIEDLFVNTAGDEMTGPLLLPIAAPVAPEEATNKKYVDDTIAAAIAAAEGLDETAFVNVVGDTMTGQLTMSYVNPVILLNKQAAGESARILGAKNGLLRWGARFGDETLEAGANVGSDYRLIRYADDGTPIGDVFKFLRSTGLGTVVGDPTDPLGIATKNYVDVTTAAVAGSVVRTDVVQAFTDAQKAQGRANISAAPFDAMGYFGLQLNSALAINQRSVPVGIAITSGYSFVTDMWLMAATAAGPKVFVGGAYSTTAVFGGVGGTYFPKCFDMVLRLACSTAGAAVAAGDFGIVTHLVEGYRSKRLGWGAAPGGGVPASPLTVSFWVMADRAGTMAVRVGNADGTRSCVINVPIAAAATGYYKSVTFPPCLDGVWNVINGTGLNVSLCFVAGTTYQSPAAGVWQNGNHFGSAATTNFFQAVNDAVYLTGISIIPGVQGPSAQDSPSIIRPAVDEMLLCQRYWTQWGTGTMVGYGQLRSGLTASYLTVQVPVPMRITPVASYGGDTKIFAGDGNATISTFALTWVSPNSVFLAGSATHGSLSPAAHGANVQIYPPTSPFILDARMI